ncbi:MAG: hypothetical protein D3M94_08430 [Rhodocyclales bacterium GT-UBC]|nr:MAG: hypothetical protein D3M94_08430 [Rhodocyclales bacterium GT-UBC]
MKTHHRLWRGIGLLGGVIVLAGLSAPADLLARSLASTCPSPCRVAAAEGYWWRGQASLYVQGGPARQWLDLGTLRWQPESGGLRIDVAGGSIRLRPRWAGLDIDLEAVRLPAELLLAHAGHGLPGSGWGGDVLARSMHLSRPWGNAPLQVQGDILWLQASSALLENQPLGDYQLRWQGDGATPGEGDLSTRHGPLQLEGRLHLAPFHFEGRARLEAAGKPLAKYLDLLGRADNGVYRISLPPPR